MQKSSLQDKINKKLNGLIVLMGCFGIFFLLFSIPGLFSPEPFYIFRQTHIFLIYVILLGCILLLITISDRDIISKWKYKDRIYSLYSETLIVLIFAEFLMITFFILHILPFLFPSLDYLNFIAPTSDFMTWFSLVEGVFIFTMLPIIYFRKRKLMQDLNKN
ncbi:MAG: hypothetical protein ACTSRS_21130 [Candidatus Helarchaeota archaeon]